MNWMIMAGNTPNDNFAKPVYYSTATGACPISPKHIPPGGFLWYAGSYTPAALL
ncbi:hypothetical protein [Paenibacillus silviterrae]|uniref:hypothetical protein n=1 Tax=Paenibacillus silviterrae TaxID=3242194 RepID=UPI0025429ACF|nr:hypothetical protein [Paenibacillus chinjuensis]